MISLTVFAQNPIKPNWDVSSVEGQNRAVTDNTNVNTSLAIVGAGSLQGNAIGNTLTVDNKQISINDTATAEEAYLYTKTSQGAYVAGGAVLNKQANYNTLNLSNLTGGTALQGRDAYGGASVLRDVALRKETGYANNNTVNINNAELTQFNFTTSLGENVTIGGNVYGGYMEYAKGSADNNTVNITNSTIEGDVYGGFVDDQLTEEDLQTPGVRDHQASNNTVYIKDSTVDGTVAGAAGAAYADNNTVVVENSTVGKVLGVDETFGIENGNSSVVHANNNTVLVKGGQISSAAALDSKSINASGNTLSLDGVQVDTGSIYAVKMAMRKAAASGEPVLATVENSTLNMNNISSASGFTELGGTVNLVGQANGNQINIQNSTFDLSNNTMSWFGGTVDGKNICDKILNLRTVLNDPDVGLMFGGASMVYDSQTGENLPQAPEVEKVAVAGTNSDGNTIFIKDSDINANILGGISLNLNVIDYSVSTPNEGAPGPTIETVEKKGSTIYKETTTWEKQADDSWLQKTETAEPETLEKIDDVHSASNNTIILENTTFEGTIFGGYAYGSELKEENMVTQNNKVILRGNIDLGTSTVYGGSNAYYSTTNQLVFDRVQGTFSDQNQFQNFNEVWNINADFDTDITFDYDGVYANVSLAPTAMQEGEKVIVKTETITDLTGIEQGGEVVDLTDNGLSLQTKRLGAYSFDLTGIKESGTTVGWKLTSKKDKANVEAYGQLPLVGFALAGSGGEMLSRSLSDAWKSESDYNSFLNAGYQHTRYETGSGFDLDSGIMQAGIWKKLDEDFLAGFFAKYAYGSYDTYPIKVSGTANVFGAGLMTSYRYSETGRFEADVEVGYMDMDFESAALLSAFDSKGSYYGASAGLVESFVENFELFANINWLRKGEDKITDSLGQKIKFDALNSINLRFGADYIFSDMDLGGVIPSISAMGIYEFAGESGVSVNDTNSKEASLKGMSGRGQISLVYLNKDSFLPLRTSLTVYGQVGNRRGFGGEVNISFEF